MTSDRQVGTRLQCVAGKRISSSRHRVNATADGIVERRSLGPIATVAQFLMSAANSAGMVGSTGCGAARTTKSERLQATARSHPIGVRWLQRPERLAARAKSGQPRAKSHNLYGLLHRASEHEFHHWITAEMSSAAIPTSSQRLLALAEAAEQLGVHYMTAYRYVRTGRMAAHKRAGQWWVAPEDLAAVLAEGTGPRKRTTADSAPREMLVEPFTARLVAGDTAGCWDLMSSALSGGATPAEVHSQLLQRSLIAIGDSWRRGELAVSDEHRATATASRLLGQMGPLFRHRGRRRGTVVVGTVSGDYHVLPTAMIADLLSDRRFEVIDLGANTPSESFTEVARGVDDLVGIGVCAVLDDAVPTALQQVREIRDSMPNVFLLAGGPAIAGHVGQEFADVVDLVSLTANDVCLAFEQALEEQAKQRAAT